MSKSKVADATAKDVDANANMQEIVAKGNTVDAAIVSLAQFTWSMGCNSRLGFIMPIFLHVASQTIQFVVLYYFYQFTLESKEDMFEVAQFDMISASINKAISTNTSLNKLTAPAAFNVTKYPAGNTNMKFYKDIHKMCGLEHSNLLVNGLALFLFVGSRLDDFHAIFSKLYVVVKLPTDGEGPDSTDDDGDIDVTKPGAKNLISSMALPLKLVAVFLILLPHLVCHIVIAIAGSKLLSYGTDPFGVIKSFLQITFISKFDAELYSAFTSVNFVAYMKVTKFAILKEKPGGLVELWGSAFSTFVKMVVAVLWACLCLFVVFHNLAAFRDNCDAYYMKFKASGYNEAIDYQHCIFGASITKHPVTNATISETCGLKSWTEAFFM